MGIMLMFSCSKGIDIDDQRQPLSAKIEVLDINENESVALADIADVIAIEQSATKGDDLREIDEVLSILGVTGDTLMYAVNYKNDRGFTLVSATRNYFPVLADVDQGRYSVK